MGVGAGVGGQPGGGSAVLFDDLETESRMAEMVSGDATTYIQ